jgi:hypothetical protein
MNTRMNASGFFLLLGDSRAHPSLDSGGSKWRSAPKTRLGMKSYRCFAAGVLVLSSLLSALTGCATGRLDQFNNLAQAGTTYVKASQAFIQEAGTATVNADSALLVKYRQDLNQSERKARVTESNTLLAQRLKVLQLISAHGKLLQAYFEALSSLSDPKATNSVGTAAQNVYDSLAKMSPTLKNAKMGTTSVSAFIPQVTAPIVVTFKVDKLDAELKARSSAIETELALQEAALRAIEDQLRTDFGVLNNILEADSINQFTAAGTLPAGWASQRLTLLSSAASVASADAASKAAEHLRSAFTAVVENRLDNAGFASLMSDISNMLAIAQEIKDATK